MNTSNQKNSGTTGAKSSDKKTSAKKKLVQKALLKLLPIPKKRQIKAQKNNF